MLFAISVVFCLESQQTCCCAAFYAFSALKRRGTKNVLVHLAELNM